MAKNILFIQHYETALEDTAWTHLRALGFDRTAVSPYLGEPLPESIEQIGGIVIYGGSQNVTELDRFPFLGGEIALIKKAIALDKPTLGICLGAQLISHALGGEVWRRDPVECEFGFYPLSATQSAGNWIPSPFYAVQAHYEEFSLPADAVKLAASERYPNQAFRFGKNIYGLQFHPETTREIFLDWQQADWAMYGVSGAQTRQQQNQLLEQHSEIQTAWFKQFLESVFTGSAASNKPEPAKLASE